MPHVCDTPTVCLYTPHIIHTPPVHLYAPQGCTHPPWAPHALQCSCMVLEHLYVVGGCFSTLNVYWDTSLTPPLFGGTSPLITPLTPLLVTCALLFSGISVSYVGAFPLLLKGLGGVSPSLGDVWGAHQLFCCPHVHSYTFFVVHYVSRLDHGSNYYSSSYCGIFWPVISLISDSGSFPNRVSRKPWCGSTTTLDAEELWKCSWLHFCAAAAYSIFNASSGLCQLCYGFSTGRFLFQSLSLPPFCILYMFGVCSGVCFLLLGAKLDAVFTYGGSTIRVCTLATLWSVPMAGICATW